MEREVNAVFWAAIVLLWMIMVLILTPAKADPYVSFGVGGQESLNQSNDDKTEFGSDPWFGLNAEIGNDAILTEGPVDVGAGIEAMLIPEMPLHGRNTGKGDANHHTADGKSITMGSGMLVVEPAVHLWDGARAYVVGGAGVGDADGAGLAYQGGVGLKQAITEDMSADLSFRYRRINDLSFVGPELRMVWNFDTPFGHKLEDEK